ncbi:helix-turn-helix transcriptional regulator [candidate division KSB1 bacterium]|nr:helix-turn-helix transcriptional regulator [candidate division KSB1 bacterium]
MRQGVGSRIQELREEKRLSQGDFAKVLGVHRNTIAKWESGKPSPDCDSILKICELYEVSPAWLLTGEGTANSQEQEKRVNENLLSNITGDFHHQLLKSFFRHENYYNFGKYSAGIYNAAIKIKAGNSRDKFIYEEIARVIEMLEDAKLETYKQTFKECRDLQIGISKENDRRDVIVIWLADLIAEGKKERFFDILEKSRILFDIQDGRASGFSKKLEALSVEASSL